MMERVELELPRGQPVDVAESVAREWSRLGLDVQGKQIAIGVGSRGVAKIAEIVRELVKQIKAGGGEPFVIPAMGSHGGATAPGQLEVLHSLGVTEASVGCPLRATMETVVVGATADGLPVHLDRNAAEADGVIVVNRVKIHTDFHGPHESGMVKMIGIGLAKQTGAALIHSYGVAGLRDKMPQCAAVVLEKANILAGLGTVEDGYHQPVHLEMFGREDIIAGDLRLIDKARNFAPTLPVDDLDVLVIERMGKDISGTGMDTNVIGRMRIDGQPEPESPRIGTIVVLDLTDASHGNATGIGLADFTVRRVLDKIDFAQTTKNIYTSGFFRRGFLPLVFETDEEAIDAATSLYGDEVRMMRIRDTLNLDEVWVTSNLVSACVPDIRCKSS